MKKVILAAIFLCLSLSGCYLLPEVQLTPTAGAVKPTTDLPSTGTGTLTPESVETSTPAYTTTVILTPSRTATVTQTFTPTQSLVPTKTLTQVPYQLQADSPVYIKNFVHTNAGCDWLGVAGQVFGEDDTPQMNLVLQVKGTLNGTAVDEISVTGVPEADVYGPGGYEIVLTNDAVGTKDSLTIQVFDLSGNALSDVVVFDTFADCEKNLVVINFQTP